MASGPPVLQCAAYQVYGRLLIPSPGIPARHDRSKDCDKRRGLCADCELRNDCTFPKPESGIWHCEHYR